MDSLEKSEKTQRNSNKGRKTARIESGSKEQQERPLRAQTVPEIPKSSLKETKLKPELNQVKSFNATDELVDALESGLAECLSTYRREAEECLMNHVRKLDELQATNDLRFANLVVENTLLREKLGLKPAEQLQTAIFQTAVADDSRKGRKQVSRDDDDDSMHKQRRTEDKILNVRKGGKNVSPGGSWQPFLAWVPNGAALNNAEPWKPLPSMDLLSIAQQGGPGRGATRVKSRNLEDALSILPGAVASREVAQFKEKACDSDSEDGMNGFDDKVELLEVWQASEKLKKRLKGRTSAGDAESSIPFKEENDEMPRELGDRHCWTINPDSNTRIIWDLLSLVMVVYDMIMVPLFVFNLPENTFLSFMDWTTRLFWTSDIGWSCCTGIVLHDGSVQYGQKDILKRYIKTWLVMDLFIVGSDWVSLIVSSNGMEVSKLARIFRIVRVIRLLRLVRMQEIIANIMERAQSEQIIYLMHLLKLLIIMAAVCHFIACGWWGIGARTSGSDSWATVYAFRDNTIEDQYLVSLQWALSQFAGVSSEVSPACALERLYSVAMCLLCYFGGLVMLSTLTSSLTQQYIIGGSGARQMATLKKYLKQNNVPKNVTKRVCRNAKHAVSGDLTPDAVELLNVISEPLKVEMHFEIYSRVLRWHHFFNDLLLQGSQVMRPVCHRAMSVILLASGDIVFNLGEEPPDPKMYMVVSGTLEYTDSYGEVTAVEEKAPVSEACLWTNWRHRGTLTANSDVKMAMLDALAFQDICKRNMRKNNDSTLVIMQYAANYVAELKRQQTLSDLCDR